LISDNRTKFCSGVIAVSRFDYGHLLRHWGRIVEKHSKISYSGNDMWIKKRVSLYSPKGQGYWG